jgi:hypothetical protein
LVQTSVGQTSTGAPVSLPPSRPQLRHRQTDCFNDEPADVLAGDNPDPGGALKVERPPPPLTARC